MRWELKISIILIISSIGFYILSYMIFHDTTFIERYLLVQLGFLPISVLLVTIVLNSLMERRERQERLEKLNIVIGSFFAEIGKDLLRYLSKYDVEIDDVAIVLERNDLEMLKNVLLRRRYRINMERMNLYELRKFLLENKEFSINILDNPVIIEHETFTDLLWNLLHVTEELRRIINFERLEDDEYKDLKDDIERLYKILSYEWIKYVEFLKRDYPHIYQYELRTNPFIPHAHAYRSRKSP